MDSKGQAGECPAWNDANNPGSARKGQGPLGMWRGGSCRSRILRLCERASVAGHAPATLFDEIARKALRAPRAIQGHPTRCAQRARNLNAFRTGLGLSRGVRAPRPVGSGRFGPATALDKTERSFETDTAAAKSAAGVRSPIIRGAYAPIPDAGAFFVPASAGAHLPALWRAVRGSRKARRPSDRSSNRVPSVTLFRSGVAVTHLSEDRTMKSTNTAAHAASFPQNLLLPIEAPRESWPGLLDHAAAALSGECIFDSETLALELRAIAAALRAEVRA